MILVMGATGHVGSQITTHLLNHGYPVRCLARYFSPKQRLEGVEYLQGDANNVGVLSEALSGCSAAFTMIPNSPRAPQLRVFQNKHTESLAAAIEESRVKKIVNLSCAGADLSQGTGPALGHHDQEGRFQQLTGTDIVHLRPAAFMENLLHHIPSILSRKKFFSVAPSEYLYDFIATRDVAARAAFLLMNPSFKGHSVEHLLGERALTFSEVRSILARTLSIPELEYVEVPLAAMENALISYGYSVDCARALMEWEQAQAHGDIQVTFVRDKINTTGTAFEDFARTTFLPLYQKARVEHAPAESTMISSRPSLGI